MGGTPRGKDKPRPSYEEGRLRDETIVDCEDATYNRERLLGLIKKAVTPARTD